MSFILDRRLLNVAEYHKMAEVGILEEKGIELIKGEIIKMSPIGTQHAACVKRLNQLLNQALDSSYIIGIQDPIQLGNLSEPEPDLTLLKPRDDFYQNQHPQAHDVLAIIEVADSSLAYDREIKGKLYAEAGIGEYYIVNLNTHTVEVYQAPYPDGYTIQQEVSKGETFTLQSIGLQVDTKRIFQ